MGDWCNALLVLDSSVSVIVFVFNGLYDSLYLGGPENYKLYERSAEQICAELLK